MGASGPDNLLNQDIQKVEVGGKKVSELRTGTKVIVPDEIEGYAAVLKDGKLEIPFMRDRVTIPEGAEATVKKYLGAGKALNDYMAGIFVFVLEYDGKLVLVKPDTLVSLKEAN